jgi:hypothetical protein
VLLPVQRIAAFEFTGLIAWRLGGVGTSPGRRILRLNHVDWVSPLPSTLNETAMAITDPPDFQSSSGPLRRSQRLIGETGIETEALNIP